jgi:hypothetical protein
MAQGAPFLHRLTLTRWAKAAPANITRSNLRPAYIAAEELHDCRAAVTTASEWSSVFAGELKSSSLY